MQQFIIRKLRPRDYGREVCHLVAHPATSEAASKPLDYSGMASLGSNGAGLRRPGSAKGHSQPCT